MNEFIEARVRLVRELADKADPFIRVRLLKLAERYDQQLGLRSKTVHRRKIPISLPSISISSER